MNLLSFVKGLAWLLALLGLALGLAVDWQEGTTNLKVLMDQIAPIISALLPSVTLGASVGLSCFFIGYVVYGVILLNQWRHRKALEVEQRESEEMRALGPTTDHVFDLLMDYRENRTEDKAGELMQELFVLEDTLRDYGIDSPDVDIGFDGEDECIFEWQVHLNHLRALSRQGRMRGARAIKIPSDVE